MNIPLFVTIIVFFRTEAIENYQKKKKKIKEQPLIKNTKAKVRRDRMVKSASIRGSNFVPSQEYGRSSRKILKPVPTTATLATPTDQELDNPALGNSLHPASEGTCTDNSNTCYPYRSGT